MEILFEKLFEKYLNPQDKSQNSILKKYVRKFLKALHDYLWNSRKNFLEYLIAEGIFGAIPERN